MNEITRNNRIVVYLDNDDLRSIESLFSGKDFIKSKMDNSKALYLALKDYLNDLKDSKLTKNNGQTTNEQGETNV